MQIRLDYDPAYNPDCLRPGMITARTGLHVPFTRATSAWTKGRANEGFVEVEAGQPRAWEAKVSRNICPEGNCATTDFGLAGGTLVNSTDVPEWMKNIGITKKVIVGGEAGTHFLYNPGGSMAANTRPGNVYRTSCFARLEDGSELTVALASTATGNFCFNVAGVGNGRKGIAYVADGWYRVWATAETQVAATNWGIIQYTAHVDFSGRDLAVEFAGWMVEDVTHECSSVVNDTNAIDRPGPYWNTGGTVPQTRFYGTNRGYLSERSATNLITYSSDLSTGWTGSSASAAQDVPNGIYGNCDPDDGDYWASTISDNNDLASGAAAMVSPNITVANSKLYMMSALVKPGSQDWFSLGALNFTTPVNSWAWFDITNGVKGTKGAGLTNSGMQLITIDDVDWYWCWATFTTDAVDNTGNVGIYISDGDGDNTIVRNGNTMVVGHVQLEILNTLSVDMTFPSTPIFTNGATATRNADLAWRSASVDPASEDIYSGFEAGGSYVEWEQWDDGSQSQSIGNVSNASTNYLSSIIGTTTGRTGQPVFNVRDAGGAVGGASGGITQCPFGYGNNYAAMGRFDSTETGDDQVLYVGGELMATVDDTSGIVTTLNDDAQPLNSIGIAADNATTTGFVGLVRRWTLFEGHITKDQARAISLEGPEQHSGERGPWRRKQARARYRRR